jgi:hypothetical protein
VKTAITPGIDFAADVSSEVILARATGERLKAMWRTAVG